MAVALLVGGSGGKVEPPKRGKSVKAGRDTEGLKVLDSPNHWPPVLAVGLFASLKLLVELDMSLMFEGSPHTR